MGSRRSTRLKLRLRQSTSRNLSSSTRSKRRKRRPQPSRPRNRRQHRQSRSPPHRVRRKFRKWRSQPLVASCLRRCGCALKSSGRPHQLLRCRRRRRRAFHRGRRSNVRPRRRRGPRAECPRRPVRLGRSRPRRRWPRVPAWHQHVPPDRLRLRGPHIPRRVRRGRSGGRVLFRRSPFARSSQACRLGQGSTNIHSGPVCRPIGRLPSVHRAPDAPPRVSGANSVRRRRRCRPRRRRSRARSRLPKA